MSGLATAHNLYIMNLSKKQGGGILPRTGRPKEENPIIRKLSVRLDAETENKLDDYCTANAVSRAEAIRRGIHLIWKNEIK